MAPEIALEAIPERADQPLVVMDPMCGSGTVLSAAIGRGHIAVGIDIDPLAVMMSTYAVNPPSPESMLRAAGDVVAAIGADASTAPWGDDLETSAFVDYWFGPEQRDELIRLMVSINAVEDAGLALALRLAISRIIVTKTPKASLAADAAHSRPHRVQLISDYDVRTGFQSSVRQLARLTTHESPAGQGTVTMGDARELSHIADDSIDLSVTSPPYLNALDYLRGHKLALVWFGHTIGELRNRRTRSIGSEKGLSQSEYPLVEEVIATIKADAKYPDTLREGMITRYAHDCINFSRELRRTVKTDGQVVLVVGNSTLRGNYIRNDYVATRAMESVGFCLQDRYERDIPPSRRYMAIKSSQTSTITNRMRSEVVLTLA